MKLKDFTGDFHKYLLNLIKSEGKKYGRIHPNICEGINEEVICEFYLDYTIAVSPFEDSKYLFGWDVRNGYTIYILVDGFLTEYMVIKNGRFEDYIKYLVDHSDVWDLITKGIGENGRNLLKKFIDDNK
jgi:hypothetical protein